MSYPHELSFLCDTLKKIHLRTAVIREEDFRSAAAAELLRSVIGKCSFSTKEFPAFRERTVYMLRDRFACCFRFLLLPDTERAIFCMGPYLTAPVSFSLIPEIGELNGISPKEQAYLQECYGGLPILPDDSHLWTMFNTFCEKIWNGKPFAIRDISADLPPSDPLIGSRTDMERITDESDAAFRIEAMEQRYSFENELIRAVEHGQAYMEKQFFSFVSKNGSAPAIEPRVSDPLRNAKNYDIIMNTLLRKAAERGGVHPVYLDQTSSDFARKIENLSSLSDNTSLMREMFRGYCRLVRKHSFHKLTPPVRRTLLLIDADLSADLSPSRLAREQGLSLSYLSTVFKKETGKTMTEHIRERRMQYATHLLRTTSLQIQTVALHCGIMDVQYFSKIFKQHLGSTPTQYRLNAQISASPGSVPE